MILKNIKIFVSLALLCLLVSCKEGCLDPIATNYNPNAKKSNDELCQYDASKNPLNLEVFHLFNGNNLRWMGQKVNIEEYRQNKNYWN